MLALAISFTIAAILFRIIKYLVIAGIFWGLFEQMTPFPEFTTENGILSPITYIFAYSTENWFPLLSGFVLFYVFSQNLRIREIETKTSTSTVGIVSILTYFRIHAKTTAAELIEEKGFLAAHSDVVKYLWPLQLMFGPEVYRDELTAKATRNGSAIDFESDCKDLFRKSEG
ncbi:MAG: hypothetical protein CVT73_01205 [Alphaproteobacteria bacterium HGW-Alphaproteobacteria-12]|nr:MAG: hypothetical protein CVT73_01205 [Alphaproteobacteria bacterium HGW-Alphaproteobacteria-12]